MAISPHSPADHIDIDFRAPPPSPVAAGRRSTVANDDFLTDYLEHSLRVPDLILPNRVFPRQNPIQDPPQIDFQYLTSPGNDAVPKFLNSIARIGCFQVVNHGIAREIIRSVSATGAGIFRLSPEKKAAVMRSPEKFYGFEEFQGDDEREVGEEFVWGRDQMLESEMEGIWPLGYSNFSDEMERLILEIEKLAGKILRVLEENDASKPIGENGMVKEQELVGGSICHLYKHCCNIAGDQCASSLRYDVIKMLIRGSDYSHALCLHLCDGASEFHVYSKKGWVSFSPDQDSIIITLGDQIQAWWSGGQYKHGVIGRPIFRGEVEDCISMAFLYSPSRKISHNMKTYKGKTISLGHQALVALLLTLICHFLVHVYKL